MDFIIFCDRQHAAIGEDELKYNSSRVSVNEIY